MSTLPATPHKDRYKLRNWKDYNRSLCNRGHLTLWINDSVDEWEKAAQKGRNAGGQTYSGSIIRCCLPLKINYGPELRQSTGFGGSLFLLAGKSRLPGYLIQRNRAVEEINKHGSKRWKQENGCHRRSLNEAAMFRYKTVSGGESDAGAFKNQTAEAGLECLASLNKFIGTGMSDAYKAS